MPQQHAKQRRLAGPVWPDDADRVAADDRRGKVLHDRTIGVSVGDVLDLGDEHAAPLRRLHDHFDRPADGTSITPRSSHRLQSTNSPFVPRAASLNSLADPNFFLGQTFVEQGVLLFFGGEGGFFASQERIVIARPIEQPTTIDFENAVRQLAEEDAIVRDEQERHVRTAQKVFEPGDRVDVQMVRRLVEQQDVGIRHQGPGQQHASLHAGREGGELRVGGQRHSRNDLFDLMFALPSGGRVVCVDLRAGDNDVVHASRHVLWDVLLQQRDLRAGRENDLAAVGLHFAAQHF